MLKKGSSYGVDNKPVWCEYQNQYCRCDETKKDWFLINTKKMGYDSWILLLNDADEEVHYEYKRSGYNWFVLNKNTDGYDYEGKQTMGDEQYHWTLKELEALIPERISFQDLKAKEFTEPYNLILAAKGLIRTSKTKQRLQELPDYGTFQDLRIFIRDLEQLSTSKEELEKEQETDTDLMRIVSLAKERKANQIVLGLAF